jgi:hypothetical protein
MANGNKVLTPRGEQGRGDCTGSVIFYKKESQTDGAGAVFSI